MAVEPRHGFRIVTDFISCNNFFVVYSNCACVSTFCLGRQVG